MSKKTILLVDDSDAARMTSRLILQRTGDYEVRIAVNGREAVAMAQEERPDLILMDVVMPEMNGFEACRALRSIDKTCAVPIILAAAPGKPDRVCFHIRIC